MEQQKIGKRSEADPKYTWATEDLFVSDDAWLEELDRCGELVGRIAAYKGRLGESAQTLLGWFKLMDEADLKLGRLGSYAHLKADEDSAVSKYQDFRGKMMGLMVKVSSAAAFEEPEILNISEETLEQFMAAEPGLKEYERSLYKIRRMKAHVLTEAEERIMAAAASVCQSPDLIGSTFRNADLKYPNVKDSEGKEYVLTAGSYISLCQSPDRVLRKNAFETLYATFYQYRNTVASILNAQVKQLIFQANMRKYNSTLEAALYRNEVPVSVYHNLLKAVHDNMGYLHRYMSLRQKIMGVDKLHMYDVLRADRCISVHSMEARVPFGDLAFADYVLHIDPNLKMNHYGKGKYLLRHAFAGDYLPQDILMREKAAFSDAVGHSLRDDLQAYAESLYSDAELETKRRQYAHAAPFTKESLLYREIFESFYPGQSQMVRDFWMPNRSWEGCDVDDPSARVLSNYGSSGC